jgi:hypothetical protein
MGHHAFGIGRLGIRSWWLGLVLALVLAIAVQAQAPGILEGQVVNGTADGPEVGAGLAVTLRAFRGETEVDTLEAVTDAGGRFRFEGLDTDPTLEYWPEVTYLDVSYSSAEPYRFDADQTALNATIMVFEPTGDDSAIRLNSVHMIAESFGQVLRISEIHLFGNSGDRTYVGQGGGQNGTTVTIPLPEGAVGLAFQDGASEERYVQVEGALLDTEPVPPGPEASLAFFSYHLMVTGKTVPLERRFAYPVTNLNILVAQPGLTLDSDQLQAMGEESFQGQQFEFYVAQNLAPDEPLVLEFVPMTEAAGDLDQSGMPAGTGASATGGNTRSNQGLLRWIGLGLAVLAVAGVVVYATTTHRPAAAPASAPDLAPTPESRRLLSELADLEDALKAGEIDEAAYERRRAELYEALKSLH